MKREELYRYLGYSSVFSYASDQHGLGRTKVSELIGISEDTAQLPRVREAFDSGRLEWTKVREVAKAATPETEQDWLELASSATCDELRAARKGEAPTRRRVLTLSLDDTAVFDQLVASAKQELGLYSDSEAALALIQRGAGGGGSEAPPAQVVITECGSCGTASTETREGPIPVSLSEVARVRCSGEVHDLRAEPSQRTQAIPTPIQRRVSRRDRRRCQVPGCRARWLLEVHRGRGWRQGQDPCTLLSLCIRHHRAVHAGLIRITGAAPSFRFVLLDGTLLGSWPAATEAPLAVSPETETPETEAPGPDPAAVSPETEAPGPDPRPAEWSGRAPIPEARLAERDRRRIALLALRAVGLSGVEARRRLLTAPARSALRDGALDDLVRAALSAG